MSIAQLTAIECGKPLTSTVAGLYEEWLYDRKAADRIAEIEGLLKQSVERLTKQMEAVTELQSVGADTTKAVLLLDETQRSCEKQIERVGNFLHQHEKMLPAPLRSQGLSRMSRLAPYV
jgi:hypothetical protein